MFELDRERIERARGLFGPGDLGQPHALVNAFECLGAEFYIRSHLLQRQNPLSPDLAPTQQLARLFRYTAFRLTDVIVRLSQLNWMQHEFEKKGGDEAAAWHSFGALAIKDFHVDVGSLMDAVAPALLQATGALNAAGEVRLPGFVDVQDPGSPRAPGFRAAVPDEALLVVDSTNRWWPAVKQTRDTLTHREHEKIVFAGAEMGVLFQIYSAELAPKVLDPRLLSKEGENVADFRLYSAGVMAELLVFLEDLGRALAEHQGLAAEDLSKSKTRRVGGFSYLIEPMEQLIATLAESDT